MREYYIDSDEDSVSISLKPLNMNAKFPSLDFYCDAFININVDIDGNFNSPFKNIEDAEVFADAIVKLLKSVELFCNG